VGCRGGGDFPQRDDAGVAVLPASGDSDANGRINFAQNLVNRHFVAQGERPPSLQPVDITVLDPFLRALLFTDGTVTRMVELQALTLAHVEVVEQSKCAAPAHAERYLDLSPGEDCVRRRIEMFVEASPQPAVFAESHIIPRRLPSDFLRLLASADEGIGQALQQLMVESARELLWCGLGTPPLWATVVPTPRALKRLYRVKSCGQSALLISESFAVELVSGVYRLAHRAAPAALEAHPRRGDK